LTAPIPTAENTANDISDFYPNPGDKLMAAIWLGLLILSATANAFLIIATDRYRKRIQSLRNTIVKYPQKNELQLDEFLYDIQRHGFSFLRVEPTSVQIRRPNLG
jgi:hypothetical protein